MRPHYIPFFLFTDPATTEFYTLSLHDALPICIRLYQSVTCSYARASASTIDSPSRGPLISRPIDSADRKSTRLNSSHQIISYAVFCLKKKKTIIIRLTTSLHSIRLYSIL